MPPWGLWAATVRARQPATALGIVAHPCL